MFIVTVLFWVGLGLLGGRIAAKKGYPPVAGVLIGVFLGPVALLIATVVMPKTSQGLDQEVLESKTQAELAYASQTQQCPQCGRSNSIATRICPRCEYRFPTD